MKLAIDLGGSNIRIARVEKGVCTDYASVACPARENEDVIVGHVSLLIKELMDERVDGIGIGVPSIVDAQKGIVYDAVNISCWKEVHLKEKLESKFHVPVLVENDCNCFALGECLFGEGRSYSDMVGVTLGTGVGLGIIVGRWLYGGLYRGAGEMGSLPYLDSDYEHYCSSFFFKQKGGTGVDFARRAGQGDAEALKVWDEFGFHLGQLVKAILFTYAPQLIVFGGGISAAFPFFKKEMELALQDFPYKKILDEVKVTVSSLKGPNLLGAASLFDSVHSGGNVKF